MSNNTQYQNQSLEVCITYSDTEFCTNLVSMEDEFNINTSITRSCDCSYSKSLSQIVFNHASITLTSALIYVAVSLR